MKQYLQGLKYAIIKTVRVLVNEAETTFIIFVLGNKKGAYQFCYLYTCRNFYQKYNAEYVKAKDTKGKLKH